MGVTSEINVKTKKSLYLKETAMLAASRKILALFLTDVIKFKANN